MKRTYSLVLSLILIASLLGISAIQPALASSSGGVGQNRWVKLETESTDNWTVSTNFSVPETIAENHTFSGTLTLNSTTSYNTTNWVNITINGTTFTSGAVDLTVNGSSSFEVETNVPKADNLTISVQLESDGNDAVSSTDTWSDTIDVVSNMDWVVGYDLPALLIGLLPLIIIVAVVIPIFVKLTEDMGEQFGA